VVGRVNPRLIVFFTAAFLGIGWYQPYFAVLLAQRGYPGWAIGLLTAVSPLVALAAGPVWGRWWDRARSRRVVLRTMGTLSLLGSTLPMASLGWGVVPLGLSLGVLAAGTTGVVPLGTAATLTVLDDPDRFGRLRLIGSFAFAVAAALGAIVYRAVGLWWLFLAYGGCLALAAWALPAVREPRPRAKDSGGRVWTGAVRWFLLAVFLTQLSNAGANSMLGLFYRARLPWTEIGWPWAWTALLEVPLFFLLPRWLARYGPARVLTWAMAGYGFRLLAYPFVHSLAGFLAVGVVQAVAFTGFYGGQVAMMERIAPPEQRGTAQSLLAAWGMGFANLVGALVGGALYSSIRTPGMFVVLGMTAGLGWLVFVARTPGARRDVNRPITIDEA
jgi:PPP family 3-phenylpropionic acid transporter